MNHEEHRPLSAGVDVQTRRINTSAAIVVALAVLGLAVYLITDHWPHVLAALPYAAIIAVVGVHFLMHRGHGHGGHTQGGHHQGGHHQGGQSTRDDRADV